MFFTEMWERFSYYGMRALLVLYLTAQITSGGFAFERASALEIYGIFTGLVYFTPLLGGLLCDKLLGQRLSIYIGGILMSLGHFLLAFSQFGEIASREHSLYVGLGLLIAGNGFFKPNISTMVGDLYTPTDKRKDSAFTIFYMGINLGAFFSPIVCGSLGQNVGWFIGFASAAVGMLVGLAWFSLQSGHLGNIGFRKNKIGENGILSYDRTDYMYIAGFVIGTALLVWGLIEFWTWLPDAACSVIKWVTIVGGSIVMLAIIGANTRTKVERSHVIVIIILLLFNIFFWAGFEQAGSTMTLFAEQNTSRAFLGMEIPASLFQSVNPVMIFVLAPLFSVLWVRLDHFKLNPNTPVKFGIALLALGGGFLLMNIAWGMSGNGLLVSPLWLVAVYFLHTVGELCLSPIGLSMITRLAPPRIVSVMMGLWFCSSAIACYLSGALENMLSNYLPGMPLFKFLTITSACSGIVLLALSSVLNKMMKE